MSTYVDEKLAPQHASIGGRAQAGRKQLLGRWGSKQSDASTIVIDTIGGREVWRRVEGAKDTWEQEVRS